jgi:hypothetical protein
MKKMLTVIGIVLFLAGCRNDTAAPENNSSTEAEEPYAVVFRNMDLQTEENTFLLTGEVHAAEPVFYYRIDQEDVELVAEEVYELEGDAGWEAFEISGELPEEAFQEEATPILMMYGKSPEGEVLHPNYIPIDIGQ